MKLVIAALGILSVGAMLWTPKPAEVVVAEFATPLKGRTPNQRHNAALSARRLNGATVQPGQIFSFNGRVGTWSRDQGYRRAPVSYNGTLIDAWGGGVCQTSTTLYNAALLAGMEILERHPHRFAPSYVAPGRDAAVAYSGVDLRFKATQPLQIRAMVRGDELVVSLIGKEALATRPRIISRMAQVHRPGETRLEKGRERPWVRNLGKPGFEVTTLRVTGDRTERISVDSYPAMSRVIEE